MWKYEKPEMEIWELSEDDVISTSSVTDGGVIEDGNQLPNPETPFKPPQS